MAQSDMAQSGPVRHGSVWTCPTWPSTYLFVYSQYVPVRVQPVRVHRVQQSMYAGLRQTVYYYGPGRWSMILGYTSDHLLLELIKCVGLSTICRLAH